MVLWEESKAKEFIVKDNVGLGEWDWDILQRMGCRRLEEWGRRMDPEIDPDQLGSRFKSPTAITLSMSTFTLADEQAEFIKNASADAKGLEEFKYIETMGNDNSNGNAHFWYRNGQGKGYSR